MPKQKYLRQNGEIFYPITHTKSTYDNEGKILEDRLVDIEQDAKSYTDTKVASLVNGAPETLDTLKEVADAIKVNENVVAALNSAIGDKANKSDVENLLNNKADKIDVNAALSNKLNTNGNASDTIIEFTEPATRENINSSEKQSILWGKVRKWFADLKPIAFSGKYTDLSDTPTVERLNDGEFLNGDAITQNFISTDENGKITNIQTFDSTLNLSDVAFSGKYDDLIGKPATLEPSVKVVSNQTEFDDALLLLCDTGGKIILNSQDTITLSTLTSNGDCFTASEPLIIEGVNRDKSKINIFFSDGAPMAINKLSFNDLSVTITNEFPLSGTDIIGDLLSFSNCNIDIQQGREFVAVGTEDIYISNSDITIIANIYPAENGEISECIITGNNIRILNSNITVNTGKNDYDSSVFDSAAEVFLDGCKIYFNGIGTKYLFSKNCRLVNFLNSSIRFRGNLNSSIWAPDSTHSMSFPQSRMVNCSIDCFKAGSDENAQYNIYLCCGIMQSCVFNFRQLANLVTYCPSSFIGNVFHGSFNSINTNNHKLICCMNLFDNTPSNMQITSDSIAEKNVVY